MLSRDRDTEELEYKIGIFKVIYDTLRICQDNIGLLKTNFLDGKENLTAIEWQKQIETYRKQYPTSRTAKAWELTEKHYRNCNVRNTSLFNEIYQYVCRNKTYFGTTLFSSFVTPVKFTDDKIHNLNYYQDTIAYNIRYFLELNMHELEHSFLIKQKRTSN